MYEYISGKLTALTPTSAVVEAGGVGYLLNISLNTHKDIESQKNVKLFAHQYIVQQDTPVMYGFASAQERELFRLLISISGIGANTARIMLSSYLPQELANIIATGNVAAIQRTKGIGAKTAERVVLELKGKVLKIMDLDIDGMQMEGEGGSLEEAISALTVLGFARNAVEKVARRIHQKQPTISPEELIRESLSQL